MSTTALSLFSPQRTGTGAVLGAGQARRTRRQVEQVAAQAEQARAFLTSQVLTNIATLVTQGRGSDPDSVGRGSAVRGDHHGARPGRGSADRAAVGPLSVSWHCGSAGVLHWSSGLAFFLGAASFLFIVVSLYGGFIMMAIVWLLVLIGLTVVVGVAWLVVQGVRDGLAEPSRTPPTSSGPLPRPGPWSRP